jgi:hypothetical protein
MSYAQDRNVPAASAGPLLVKKIQTRTKKEKKTQDGRKRCVEGFGSRPSLKKTPRRKRDFQTG